MTLSENMILCDAIEQFGEQSQIIMAMEETAELTQALSKWLRGNNNQESIAEEMADVYIMLRQLQIIFRNENKVDTYIEKKIERLSEKLSDTPPRQLMFEGFENNSGNI